LELRCQLRLELRRLRLEPRCRLGLEPRCRLGLEPRSRLGLATKTRNDTLQGPGRGVLRRRLRGQDGRGPKCARLGLTCRPGLWLRPARGCRLGERRLRDTGLGRLAQPLRQLRRSISRRGRCLRWGTEARRRLLLRAGSRQRLYGCRRPVLRNRRRPGCLGPPRLYRCGRPVVGGLTPLVLRGRRLVPRSRLDGRTRLLMRGRWPEAVADSEAVRQPDRVAVDGPL